MQPKAGKSWGVDKAHASWIYYFHGSAPLCIPRGRLDHYHFDRYSLVVESQVGIVAARDSCVRLVGDTARPEAKPRESHDMNGV